MQHIPHYQETARLKFHSKPIDSMVHRPCNTTETEILVLYICTPILCIILFILKMTRDAHAKNHNGASICVYVSVCVREEESSLIEL